MASLAPLFGHNFARVRIFGGAPPLLRAPNPTGTAATPLRHGSTAEDPGTGVLEVVRKGGGQMLAQGLRTEMEDRLQADFSAVRIHTDARAADSAAALSAMAYTIGDHVVFGPGGFSPGDADGMHRLAHELVHVQQQRRSSVKGTDIGSGLAVGDRADSFEREADETARKALASRRPEAQRAASHRAGPSSASPQTIQRTPRPVAMEAGGFDPIENAYGAGSLDEENWVKLVDAAELAAKQGNVADANRKYLMLYADVATLAHADAVVEPSDRINVVSGKNKHECTDAKPGLNFSPRTDGEWGAVATTAVVDGEGNFGTQIPPGRTRISVATVLTRSAFSHGKEEALGILRHEMVHVETTPVMGPGEESSEPRALANTELIGHVEGFMTMFRLEHPSPDKPTDAFEPAFQQLLGALSTKEVNPWAQAEQSVQNEAMRRLQVFYCSALDKLHRIAFDNWVRERLNLHTQGDELVLGTPSPDESLPGSIDDRTLARLRDPDVAGANARQEGVKGNPGPKEGEFLRRLGSFRAKCQVRTPSMKL